MYNSFGINYNSLNARSTRIPRIIQNFSRSVLSDVGKLAVSVALGITNKAISKHTLRFDNDKDGRGLYPFVRISYDNFKKYNGDGYKSVHHGLLQAQKLGIIKLHKPNQFTRTSKIEFISYTLHFQNAKSQVAKKASSYITNKNITNSKQSTKYSYSTKHSTPKGFSGNASNARNAEKRQKRTESHYQTEREAELEYKRKRNIQQDNENTGYILKRSLHLQASMGLPKAVSKAIATICGGSYSMFKKVRGMINDIKFYVRNHYQSLIDSNVCGYISPQRVKKALTFEINSFFTRFDGKSFAGKLKYIFKTAFDDYGFGTTHAWKSINISIQNYYTEAIINYSPTNGMIDPDYNKDNKYTIPKNVF